MEYGLRGLAVLCALGCVSTPPADLLERAERVAVVSRGSAAAGDLRARGRLESSVRGAGNATAEAIGICSSSGGDGDFAAFGMLLCLSLATLVGGVAGGVAGASAGLPAQTVEELNRELEAYLATRDLQEEFVRVLGEQIAPLRELTFEDPELVLEVELRKARLRQHAGGRISLELETATRLTFPSAPGERAYSRNDRYEGSRQHVDEWLANHGSGVAEQLASGFGSLSSQIVRGLWRDSTPSPRYP